MAKWYVSYPASSPLANYHSIVEAKNYDDALKEVTGMIGGAFSSLYRDNAETRRDVAKFFPTEIPLGTTIENGLGAKP